MDREKVVELLKNYRAYVIALRNYHRQTSDELEQNPYLSAAPCRVTLYSDTPVGRGSGSRPPTLTGGWSLADHLHYQSIVDAVQYITEALDALTADERSVIELKYMDGLTLEVIAQRKAYSRRTIRRIHSRALMKLEIALGPVRVPEVEKVSA